MATDEQTKLNRIKMPDIGDLLDNRYRIQSLMATGGMGVILRAEQLPMQRPVAIKLLHPHIATSNPKVVDRFQQEVRLAKLLNHPNTIRLYDFGESCEGLIYVAMEYLEGVDLKRLLADEGALSVGRASDITRQMLDGLAEAHSHDFIHRDLKPSNVFITENRRGEDFVKLLDFGIAKSLDGSEVDLTASGSICGTPGYVAPEYLRSESLVKASDVYAVGLMFLEMLTGQRVFQGEAAVQTMMMHLQIDPDIPPAIEKTPLAAILRKATAKDPAERYADADVMLKALEAVIDEVPGDLRVGDYQYPSERMVSVDAVTPPPKVAGKLAAESSSEFDEDSSASIPEADKTPLAMSSASSGVHPLKPKSRPPKLPSGIKLPVPKGVGGEEIEVEPVEVEPVEVEPVEVDATATEPIAADAQETDSAEMALDEMASIGVTGLSGRRLLTIGGGLAGLLVLAIVAVVVLDPGRPSQDEGSDDTAAVDKERPEMAAIVPPSAPDLEQASEVDAGDKRVDKVRFDLDTDPSGASAHIGGRTLGTTPLVYEVEPDKLPQQVTFEMDGHREATRELTRDGVPLVVEVLVEEPAESVAGRDQRASRAGRLSTRGGAGAKSEKGAPDKDGERNNKLSDDKVEKVLDELLVE